MSDERNPAAGGPGIVLLGDSILDNKSYTEGEPSVVEHLNAILDGQGWAQNLAVDGSSSINVQEQLAGIPADATHIVLSSGGNDALQYEGLLGADVGTMAEALTVFIEPMRTFRADYEALQSQLLPHRQRGVQLLVCTIFNGNFPEPYHSLIRVALALFNDIIYQLSHEYDYPTLELRRICTEASDYANPIEPSGSGGRKIAQAIAAHALAH